MSAPFLFCFDIESLGLHGPAFSVGWVVVDQAGDTMEENILSVEPYDKFTKNGFGDADDIAWCKEHIPPLAVNCKTFDHLRETFWASWLEWKAKGAIMVADCAWPVEARFLVQCIEYDISERKWKGPYPLHDLASMRLAIGDDPTGSYDRIAGEIPMHNPLCDARQTARHAVALLFK